MRSICCVRRSAAGVRRRPEREILRERDVVRSPPASGRAPAPRPSQTRRQPRDVAASAHAAKRREVRAFEACASRPRRGRSRSTCSTRGASAARVGRGRESPVRRSQLVEDLFDVQLVGLARKRRSARSISRAGGNSPSSIASHSVSHALPRVSGSRMSEDSLLSQLAARGVEMELAVADAAAVRQDEQRRRHVRVPRRHPRAAPSAATGTMLDAVRVSERDVELLVPQQAAARIRIALRERQRGRCARPSTGELGGDRRAAGPRRPTRGSTPRDPPACARRASESDRSTSRCRTRSACR